MAKGQIAKTAVASKIIEFFGKDAFLYNDGKEIRINTTENGEPVQIKLTMTCAKTPVSCGDEAVFASAFDIVAQPTGGEVSKPKAAPTQATPQEQENVSNLLNELGIEL